MKAVRVWGE